MLPVTILNQVQCWKECGLCKGHSNQLHPLKRPHAEDADKFGVLLIIDDSECLIVLRPWSRGTAVTPKSLICAMCQQVFNKGYAKEHGPLSKYLGQIKKNPASHQPFMSSLQVAIKYFDDNPARRRLSDVAQVGPQVTVDDADESDMEAPHEVFVEKDDFVGDPSKLKLETRTFRGKLMQGYTVLADGEKRGQWHIRHRSRKSVKTTHAR